MVYDTYTILIAPTIDLDGYPSPDNLQPSSGPACRYGQGVLSTTRTHFPGNFFLLD